MKIRAIIVDDERLAREGIKTFLAEEPDVEVVGECADGASAVRAVEERRPDLLFLDVQMPRLNGFDVLEAIAPELMPLVIFTTAHDEHAIRAFEVNALDYLLKPFKQARFKAALQRAREQWRPAPPRSGPAAGIASGRPAWSDARSPAHSGQVFRSHFVFEGRGNRPHRGGGQLPGPPRGQRSAHCARHDGRDGDAARPAGFMRISRSAIVNLNRIGQLEPLVAPGEFCVILKSGARLNMTCSLSELQRRMGVA
jgi:two-component system LytT family response regulator